jgi:hypothetical protein
LYDNPIASRLVFSFDFPIANCLSNMTKVALRRRGVSGHEILMIKKSIYTMYIQLYSNMVRRMIPTITQITLKENKTKRKK